MKTLALILLALGLSYTSPRAQVGVITHQRNGRTVTTTIQTPGTRVWPNRTTTVYTTPPVYSTTTPTTQRYYSRRHNRFMYRTETPYVYTAPNAGIANARLHGGQAHAYGLEHRDVLRRERFARMNRER
jgi:hypothetical protein